MDPAWTLSMESKSLKCCIFGLWNHCWVKVEANFSPCTHVVFVLQERMFTFVVKPIQSRKKCCFICFQMDLHLPPRLITGDSGEEEQQWITPNLLMNSTHSALPVASLWCSIPEPSFPPYLPPFLLAPAERPAKAFSSPLLVLSLSDQLLSLQFKRRCCIVFPQRLLVWRERIKHICSPNILVRPARLISLCKTSNLSRRHRCGLKMGYFYAQQTCFFIHFFSFIVFFFFFSCLNASGRSFIRPVLGCWDRGHMAGARRGWGGLMD